MIMQEIKINQTTPMSPASTPLVAPKRKSKWHRVILLVIVLIAVVGFWSWEDLQNNNPPTAYSAVFLSNGQVYFGKMVRHTGDEIILNDVYYLQVSQGNMEGGINTVQETLTEPSFSLVKLGQELHGPTDELFINTYHVLFYETLRDDSNVVQSIEDNSSVIKRQ